MVPAFSANQSARLTEERLVFHARLLAGPLSVDSAGIPTIADRHSKPSVAFSRGIVQRLGERAGDRLAGQSSGRGFERAVGEFLEAVFPALVGLRPGQWVFGIPKGSVGAGIAAFDQYSHLADLQRIAAENATIAGTLGRDYIIKPDILIGRMPESDETINASQFMVDEHSANLAPLRQANSLVPILHASVSCKWTIRSDRAQNARAEGLNLIKNRKGPLPHVVVVTAEPLPGRLASIALGTGEIDCVYHIALPELQQAVADTAYEDSADLLDAMVAGRRLRDIADLPLDLAV